MVSATPDAGPYFWGRTIVEPVSACRSLRFRETGIRGQRIKAPKLPPKPNPRCQRLNVRGACRLLGALRPPPGNLPKRGTAWWAREDSNLQPDRYALLVSFLKMDAACSEREHQSNIARDFLGTFRRELSVLVPKFPVLFRVSFGGATLSTLIYLKNLERAAGIEPATYSLGSCRSTTELRPQLLDFTYQVSPGNRLSRPAGPSKYQSCGRRATGGRRGCTAFDRHGGERALGCVGILTRAVSCVGRCRLGARPAMASRKRR
jgi:hypothetical protein